MKTTQKPQPGIGREVRISEDGLDRLERQLASGKRISNLVLQQWIKRYGHKAEQLIAAYQAKKL